MNQVGNVLAAVGQFPQDDMVLARAAEIARAHHAKLTIVHVVDDFSDIFPVPVDLALIQHQIHLIALEGVEAAIARQKLEAPVVDIRIEVGPPHERLIELANEIGADLVVMRAHQGNSIYKKFIGSTADRLIRGSCVPVLVVKRPVKQAYQRVVIALDLSDDSAKMVPFVDALFTSAGLSFIHVVQIPHQFEAAMLRAGVGQSVAHHRDDLIGTAKIYLRDLCRDLGTRPIRSETRVIAGDPATSLVRATWSPKVDLIVLGSGGTGTIRRALLGSVSQRVLRAATSDVLIYRPAWRNLDE